MTYKMATTKRRIAKDIVRAAKEMGLGLFFKCNKELHRVEFLLEADDYEFICFCNTVREYSFDRMEYIREQQQHIYG